MPRFFVPKYESEDSSFTTCSFCTFTSTVEARCSFVRYSQFQTLTGILICIVILTRFPLARSSASDSFE